MKTTLALSLALAGCLSLAVVGCGDDDDDNGGAAGTAGAAGAAGMAGAAGAAGDGTGTGPAANLPCTSSGKNAFETYGVDAFLAVNDQIFANVGAESTANGTTNLGDSFTKVSDAAKFKTNLGTFLVYAYGGPNMYKGNPDMTQVHTGMAISEAQYDYFVAEIVVPALTAKGVKSEDISSCFAPPLTALKPSIINK